MADANKPNHIAYVRSGEGHQGGLFYMDTTKATANGCGVVHQNLERVTGERWTTIERLSAHDSHLGVYWVYSLSCDGGWYTVFQTPDVDDARLEAAVAHIWRQYDVVRLSTIKLASLIGEAELLAGL